jgi:hypothetical protein
MSERSSRKSGRGRATPKTARAAAPPGPVAPPSLPPETLRNLLGDLEQLRVADPLAIEIRASFAWGLMQRGAGVELFRALMAALNEGLRRGSPDARDYLRMLATVAEPGVAKQFAQLLRHAGIVALPPRWVNHAGRAVVEQAFLYEYELGDVYNVNLLCRFPGAAEQHELVAFFDANYGWFVDIGAFGKTSPSDDLPDEVRRREMTLAEARAHIERGLEWAPALMDHPDTVKITSRLRLIAHYGESMPEGFELPERVAITDEARDALVDDFLASSHGASLRERPEFEDPDTTRALVGDVVTAAHDVLDGKPLRLTPQSIGLVSMAVRGDAEDDPDARLPLLLRALVAFAHERNGWADRHVVETLDAIA